MMDDDAALMAQLRDGDRTAFDALFQRYSSPLVNFLARMVPDRGRAEELAQEVFVRIYQARERYEPRARFSTYLFGIAHNLALNELDRAYRKRERPLAEPHLVTHADPEPDALDQLQGARTAEALERALARLPERQRSALLMRAQEDLGYDEIAEILGATRSSVKSLLHRARENLLALLEEEKS